MPTLAIIDGFSHGSITSGAGGVYDSVGTTALQSETTIVRTGPRSLKVAAVGTATCFAAYTVADTLLSGSFYLRFETLPTTDIAVMAFINASGGSQIRFNGLTDGKLAMFAVAGRTSFGPVLQAQTWYLVDWKYDSSTGTISMTGRVNNEASTEGTRSGAQATATCTAVRIGTGATTETFTAYYDGWLLAKNITDYPIGAHTVRQLMVTADGTHVTSADFQTAAAVSLSGTTTSYQLVDDVPLDVTSTDGVMQVTADATAYLEWVCENLPSDPDLPMAVRAYEVDSDSSATGANAVITRVVLEDGTAVSPDVRLSTDDPGTTATVRKKMLTAPGGVWTRTQIDGLRWRHGLSADVAPTGRCWSVMLEVALQPPAPPVRAFDPIPFIPRGRSL